jgi:hypothetical protein
MIFVTINNPYSESYQRAHDTCLTVMTMTVIGRCWEELEREQVSCLVDSLFFSLYVVKTDRVDLWTCGRVDRL